MIYAQTVVAVLVLGIGTMGVVANLFLVDADEFTRPRPPRRTAEPGIGVVVGALFVACSSSLLWCLWGGA